MVLIYFSKAFRFQLALKTAVQIVGVLVLEDCCCCFQYLMNVSSSFCYCFGFYFYFRLTIDWDDVACIISSLMKCDTMYTVQAKWLRIQYRNLKICITLYRISFIIRDVIKVGNVLMKSLHTHSTIGMKFMRYSCSYRGYNMKWITSSAAPQEVYLKIISNTSIRPRNQSFHPVFLLIEFMSIRRFIMAI